jgi:cytochrome c-type biogenesis protein CcmH
LKGREVVKGQAVAWVLIGIALIVVVVALWSRSGTESDAERAQRLGREFACPVCTGESVGASNSSEARAMRSIIQDRIAAGDTDDDIKARFVAAYGERILLEPDRGGLGIIVWGVPILGVVLGGGGIYLALRRWSRAPRLVASEADERLVERLREGPRT